MGRVAGGGWNHAGKSRKLNRNYTSKHNLSRQQANIGLEAYREDEDCRWWSPVHKADATERVRLPEGRKKAHEPNCRRKIFTAAQVTRRNASSELKEDAGKNGAGTAGKQSPILAAIANQIFTVHRRRRELSPEEVQSSGGGAMAGQRAATIRVNFWFREDDEEGRDARDLNPARFMQFQKNDNQPLLLWRYYHLTPLLTNYFISVSLPDRGPVTMGPWYGVIRVLRRLREHHMDLMSLCPMRLGNGLSTDIWHGRWWDGGILAEVFPRVYALEVHRVISVGDCFRLGWSTDVLRRLPRGGVEQTQWESFLSVIRQVTLHDRSDRLGWTEDTSDCFSVASARRWLDRATLFRGGVQTTWNNWVPIKLNVLLWRINLAVVPTRERVSSRGIMVESILCPVCGVAVESIDHLFVECSQLREIWHRLAIWWGVDVPRECTLRSFLDWSRHVVGSSGQRKAFEAVIITTVWVLWNFRNASIFALTPPRNASIFDEVVDRSYFWISNRYLFHLMSVIRKLKRLRLPFKDIEVATRNFTTIIGTGGYGDVYKGELLLSGKLTSVAVKRLPNNNQSGQGLKEFLTEIHLLSQYKHPNLVSLLGYCKEGDEKIIVYEYAEHGSLDMYLSMTNTTFQVPWKQRVSICIDAAKGLDYLHNHVAKNRRVIHRDIKSANILLDHKWRGMISDFGLAKIGRVNEDESYLITHVGGTHGYCDPAYINTGILTKESDVYSFGVVLFEVLCGRPCFMNVNDETRFLAQLAQTRYEKGKLIDIIDIDLRRQMDRDSLNMVADIAYQCLHKNRRRRPSMGLVVKKLEKALKLQELAEKSRPVPRVRVTHVASEMMSNMVLSIGVLMMTKASTKKQKLIAAFRKLQGEIDRVLKKVQEGVDVFDSIWNKARVYDTDNANQKEKFEADLKKEIKKLQRYRDQIKTWIQSSEIKDKKVSASYEQALMDARKLIEREMERFKICEKETKTKAFSKEGLGQQPKTDPKEKAKSETRDWLNNTVSELESQIDSFEAEMEGLSVKKGKARPPRLTHLESSISRHKAHIMKLELILRLLDNDELSPEQVNDVKDFIDDYVERNQEDFEEFEDVDMLYNTLSLDKVEALEDLVIIVPPGKGVGATGAVLSTKNALSSPPVQSPGASVQEQTEETLLSQDSISEHVPRTPPPKPAAISASSPTPSGTHVPPISVVTTLTHSNLTSVPPSPGPSPSPVRGILDNSVAVSTVPSSPISKEEDVGGFPVRKSSPALSESGLRNLGRGSLTSQSAVNNPTSSISSNNGVVPELGKRPILGSDMVQQQQQHPHPVVSSLSSRMMLPQSGGGKSGDGGDNGNGNGNGNGGEGGVGGMGTRVFSPSGVPGIQWRPGSSFQTQHEGGQFRGRTEIAPDQREKFLQRFQQVQQQGSLGMPPKQPFSTQQNPLLHQFNSQSSTGLGGGAPPQSPNTATSAQQQQQSLIHLQSSQQALMSTGSKDSSEISNTKADEMEQQQQQQSISDDSAADSAQISKNTVNEEDQKVSYGLDMQQGGGSGSMTDSSTSRDVDLSPGQPLQSNQSVSLGVIGRRSLSDLGAIGDNLSGLAVSLGGTHDQQYNLQMLESAFYKLPQPRDSERAKSYTARHPAVTPQSYPQVQAPIVNNPAFWERLGSDNIGTDTLFFAFYYQQNAYQQYLAAKELKKQSWRYHKKYNTWFQRHEEPKFATDDYEQGTYVYFDFHIGNDEMQNGWCQRIKTDFKFEYNFLEDELIV
ncbi:hypothetical protein LXL04_014377 [Taraxacum kok-saghyz]